MHNSISKKLLAGALSVMMVLSLVAPTNAQAASSYSLKQKSGLSKLTADKAYTYYVKGVKSTQYIKVTKSYKDVVVKKDNTTVKKTTKIKGTGKTITLKLTAPDKVKNYKNTLKVKVYNKKTNKLVKTLKRTATIKVKALEIKSVEPATYEASGNVKYLNVTFNKALDSLDASEVSIRNAVTEQLFTVKEVELAKNGKSAVITLLGNDQAGTTGYLATLTDYVLKVTKDSVSANIKFVIPAYGTGIVTSIDPTNKKITVGAATLYIKDKNFDYFDMLGRDVFVKYNEDQEITSISAMDNKVVYGSLTGASAANSDGSITFSMPNGDKYTTQVATVGSNTISKAYAYTANLEGYAASTAFALKGKYTNAKVVLNANGTIRRVIEYTGTTDYIVDSVKDNYVKVKNGTKTPTELNFKDYTVVKNNKTVTVADIVAGDYVMVNAAKKYAVIVTDKKEAEISAVYTDRAVVGGETLSYSTPADQTYFMSRVRIDDVNVAQDATYNTDAKALEHGFNVLKAGGKVTVYKNTFGDVAFVVGTAGAVETNTNPYIVVGNFSTYNQANALYLQATLSDGKNTIKLAQPLSDFTKLGNLNAKDSTNKGYTVKALAASTDDAHPEYDATVVGLNKAVITYANAPKTGTAFDMNDLANKLVYVTTDKNNKVVGITAQATNTTTAAIAASTDLAKNPSLGGFVTTTATPVFVVDTANSKVTQTTLGAENSKLKSTATASYVVADTVNKNVKYAVIYKNELETTTTAVATHKTALVVDAKTVTNADDSTKKNIVELKVVEAGKDVTDENIETYTLFDDATNGTGTPTEKQVDLTTLKAGDVIELGLAADGKTVVATANTTAYNKDLLNNEAITQNVTAEGGTSTSLTIGGTTVIKHDSSVVYQKKVNGATVTFTRLTWDEAVTAANAGKISNFKWSAYQGNSANVAGVIVLTLESSRYGATAEYLAAKGLIDPKIAAFSAHAAIPNATANTQTTVTDLLSTWATSQVNDASINVTITDVTFTAATAGSTDGSVSYKVTLTKDGYTASTASLNTTISK